jgi:transcriptional regulator with XRE-family HTH domain
MSPSASIGPVLTRRRLRSELRRLRETAGLSLEQVAREMVWSMSKIVRIENGAVGVSVNDAKALLALYRVTETETIDGISELAKNSRRRMWWSQFRGQVPDSFLEFIGLEHDAARIVNYHPSVVPGPIQTEEYARWLTETDPSTRDAASQVEIRMRRQDRLFRSSEPPEYVAALDEAVLYRRIGNNTVLRDQLNALLDYAREPHIELSVIPTDTDGYPGVPVGFVILEFSDRRDSPIVFHDQHGAEISAESPDEVERYFKSFDQLRSLGLHGADAIAAIKAARDRAV